jgi:hypothetical protein
LREKKQMFTAVESKNVSKKAVAFSDGKDPFQIFAQAHTQSPGTSTDLNQKVTNSFTQLSFKTYQFFLEHSKLCKSWDCQFG